MLVRNLPAGQGSEFPGKLALLYIGLVLNYLIPIESCLFTKDPSLLARIEDGFQLF